MNVKVTAAEYKQFQEHYAWTLLKNPSYRLGQAFLNYFPRISLAVQQTEGTVAEFRFYNETNNQQAQQKIDQWREHLNA
jgi:hypothetical protein